ncbi:hypothetical protein LCGC14_1540690 [marine sediment metagenome]|uniref:Uncharacterized protein n=1 Tax=marine sediment metagenome TaxID=412755 RepID=A0A0F9LTW6_9ZZZZ
MATYTKAFTIDFTDGGDTIYQGIDKNEDNVDQLVSDLNNAHTTTRGDMIYKAASAVSRLAIGGAMQMIQSDGTDPKWFPNINYKIDTKISYTDTDSISVTWPDAPDSDGPSAVNVNLSSTGTNRIYYLHMKRALATPTQPASSEFQFSTAAAVSSNVQVGVVIVDGSQNIRKFYCPSPGQYLWDAPLKILNNGNSSGFANVDFQGGSGGTQYAPNDAAYARIRCLTTSATFLNLRVDGSTSSGVAVLPASANAVAVLKFPLTLGILEYQVQNTSTNGQMWALGFDMF